jgi:hypothetical protein
MLADVPAGGNPAGGACPVTTVVILGSGKGDRPAGSPRVEVSVGWIDEEGLPPRSVKDNGYPPSVLVQSDPPGRRASRQAVARANRSSLEIYSPLEADGGGLENVEPFTNGRRPCHRRRNWAQAADGFSGVHEDGMPTRNDSESTDPLVGRLGAPAQRRPLV